MLNIKGFKGCKRHNTVIVRIYKLLLTSKAIFIQETCFVIARSKATRQSIQRLSLQGVVAGMLAIN